MAWSLSVAPRALRALVPLLVLAAFVPAQQHGIVRPDGQEEDAQTRAAVLRAMLLLKLAPYLTLETPRPQPPKEFRFGIVGQDAVTQVAVQKLTGKRVDEAATRVVVVDLASACSGKQADDYDLLYIATTVDREAVAKIVAAHTKKAVPLVSERPGFAQNGGHVQLFVKDNAMRFEVNAEALKRQGVHANSQLLKLSRRGPTE